MILPTHNQSQELVRRIQDLDITTTNENHNSKMYPAVVQTNPNANTNCTTRLVSASYDEAMAPCPESPGGCSAVDTSTDTIDTSSSSSSTTSQQEPQYDDIEQKYQIDSHVLGSGHHGSVRQCMNRTTGVRYAVKTIDKSQLSVKPGCLQREILLLDEMKHENVIELVDVFEDERYLHIVTDLCTGGELFDKIVERASSNTRGTGCFSEGEAARILHQLLTALQYLHRRNIVHRDIKPENILFQSSHPDSPIKIIDFGLARKHYADRGEPPMRTVVGTPYYIAPDVLRKSYDKACDLWSVGVIAYILFSGYPPFNGNNNNEVYESVKRGMYWFPQEDWKNVSVGARDFIHRLLQKDPRKRMTVEQALRHPWLVGQMQCQVPSQKRPVPLAMRMQHCSPRQDVHQDEVRNPIDEEENDKENDTSVEVIFKESLGKACVMCDGVVVDATRVVE
mmetsp:Transcript_25961/g.54696  ORF Transcript_25961/g.54696 Transcript_25961/m.54696 type:complete len:451 (+) Transcript_25961:665-2017(+)